MWHSNPLRARGLFICNRFPLTSPGSYKAVSRPPISYWLTNVMARNGIRTTGRIPSIGVPMLEWSSALVKSATPSCIPPKLPVQNPASIPTRSGVPIGNWSKSPTTKGTGVNDGVKGVKDDPNNIVLTPL